MTDVTTADTSSDAIATSMKKVVIADHHGFCMGVKRAINIAEETKTRGVENVTILKEIVHNHAVVEKFRKEGIDQKFEVKDIEKGTVIVSAHGVSPHIIRSAKEQGLDVIDATCPLVTRIHDIIDKLDSRDYTILHFGDEHHDETMGVLGHAKDGMMTVIPSLEALMALPDEQPEKLALTTQTTAEASEFDEAEKKAIERWPHIKVFNTICNATNQRQSAIMKLAPEVDMILVVGSTTSANSVRLASMAEALCGKAYLIDSEADIQSEWFNNSPSPIENIGISAGASTPEFLVDGVVERLVEMSGGGAEVVRPVKAKKVNTLALQDDCS